MAYCTSDQLAAQFKGGEAFTTSTEPTLAAVQAWIEEADAKINSALAGRYVVPITGTEALLVVRSISLDMVRARVQDFLEVKTGQDNTSQGKGPAGPAETAAKLLKSISEGKMELRDATKADENDGIRSSVLSDETEPYFTIDEKMW